LKALTRRHGCIKTFRQGREGGAVPKTIAVLGSALFFAVCAQLGGGARSMVVTHWEFRAPFFDLEADARRRDPVDRPGSIPGLSTRLTLCAARIGQRRPPIAPDAELVVDGSLSLRAQILFTLPLSPSFWAQAALFGDQRLLLYGVLVWLAFHAFVVGYEEPALVHRFERSIEDFGPTSRAGFRGSRPGEPHDARSFVTRGAAAKGVVAACS